MGQDGRLLTTLLEYSLSDKRTRVPIEWGHNIGPLVSRESVMERDLQGRTALHWALYEGAPVEIVKAMVAAYPESTSIPDLGESVW